MVLTDVQKSIILTRIYEGVSIRRIAEELGVSTSTILRAKRSIRDHGTIRRLVGSGRKTVTTAVEDEQLVNYLRLNPFHTVIRAKEVTGFSASLITARRRIKNSELKNYASANKIFLTQDNKENRIRFAQEYLQQPDNFWDNIVFSDEKTFQSNHNGTLRVYRPRGMRYNPQYTRKINPSGRFSVNVWGWMSSRGPGVCLIINERLNAIVYRRILNDVMLPSVLPVFRENFTFQQVLV